MERKYLYSISYNFKNKQKDNGFGNITITRNREIKTFEDFEKIVNLIKNEENLEVVIILNIQKLPI